MYFAFGDVALEELPAKGVSSPYDTPFTETFRLVFESVEAFHATTEIDLIVPVIPEVVKAHPINQGD